MNTDLGIPYCIDPTLSYSFEDGKYVERQRFKCSDELAYWLYNHEMDGSRTPIPKFSCNKGGHKNPVLFNDKPKLGWKPPIRYGNPIKSNFQTTNRQPLQ